MAQALIDWIKLKLAWVFSPGTLFLIAVAIYMMVWGAKLTSAAWSNVALVAAAAALAGAVWKTLAPIKKLWLRAVFGLFASAVLALASYALLWEHRETRAVRIAVIEGLARTKKWDEVRSKLEALKDDAASRDAVLFYSGRMYLNAVVPISPDPEQYLGQISADSEFYGRAQWYRFQNWHRLREAALGKRITDSIEAAAATSLVYYRIRVEEGPVSFDEIYRMDRKFRKAYGSMYDFNSLKWRRDVRADIPFAITVNEFAPIPGIMILLTARKIEAAYESCMESELKSNLVEYQRIRKGVPDLEMRGIFKNHLGLLLQRMDATIEAVRQSENCGTDLVVRFQLQPLAY